MLYKQSIGPKGRPLYFAAEEVPGETPKFKMVAKGTIPEAILADLEPQKPLSNTKPDYRKCLFCDQPGTEERFLNGQYLYLCLHHYDTTTSGAQVEKLRETVASNES